MRVTVGRASCSRHSGSLPASSPRLRGGQAALTRRVSADPWMTRLVLQGTPGLPVSKQGEGLTSPRSVRSRDGGRGSPSAESLSSLAGDDGDSRRNTSLGPRSQDGGSGSRLGAGSLTPRASDQLRRRRRSRTPVREHGLSRSASSDSSEASRSVAADAGPVNRLKRLTGPAGRSSGSTGPAGRVVRPDRPVRPSAESDRPVKEHNPAGRVVRPDADRRDFSDRRHSRREDSRDRGRSRRRRERSVSSSPSDSELERESRRERRRHGRSRRRGDRTLTPPQSSSLATDQILKAIAELKSATDAVTSRVHGLVRREGATCHVIETDEPRDCGKPTPSIFTFVSRHQRKSHVFCLFNP